MATPPTVNGQPLLGVYNEIKKDVLGYSLNIAKKHGGIVRYKQLGKYCYQVTEPEYVKQVLQTNFKNYTKPALDLSRIDEILKGGLLGVNGDKWSRQRRIMQPHFTKKALQGLYPTIVTLSEELATKWESKVGQKVSVYEEMGEALFSIITQTMLGINISDLRLEFFVACKTINEQSRDFNLPARLIGKYFPLIPNPSTKKADDAVKVLHSTVTSIINERKGSTPKNDLLQVLMDAKDEESGEGYDDIELRNQIITLILAGFETSANTLTWLWGLLDQNPSVQSDLINELESVLGGRAPAEDDLNNLKILNASLKEGMRLYPPVHTFTRQSTESDVIDGFEIPSNSKITLQPYVTHRNPDYWDDPESFNPQRFIGEEFKKIHKYAYLPFGGGPRLCVGYHLAFVEMAVLMSILLQRFKLTLGDYTPIVMVHSTLTEANGMPMTIEAR